MTEKQTSTHPVPPETEEQQDRFYSMKSLILPGILLAMFMFPGTTMFLAGAATLIGAGGLAAHAYFGKEKDSTPAGDALASAATPPGSERTPTPEVASPAITPELAGEARDAVTMLQGGGEQSIASAPPRVEKERTI